jgi:hypothetical protein
MQRKVTVAGARHCRERFRFVHFFSVAVGPEGQRGCKMWPGASGDSLRLHSLPPYKPRKSGGSGVIARPSSCSDDRAAVVTWPSKILHHGNCSSFGRNFHGQGLQIRKYFMYKLVIIKSLKCACSKLSFGFLDNAFEIPVAAAHGPACLNTNARDNAFDSNLNFLAIHSVLFGRNHSLAPFKAKQHYLQESPQSQIYTWEHVSRSKRS